MNDKLSGFFLASALFTGAFVVGCSGLMLGKAAYTGTVKSADGSIIHYSVAGQGDTALVFVPCWTCDNSFWTRQLDYFSNRYQVVSLDLAGHGQSGNQRSQYTMEAFGQDVVAVANKLQLKQIVLIGHSMGGPVAMTAAQRLGKRVVGIVGVDTFYTPFVYPKSTEQINAFVQPFRDDYVGTTTAMVKSLFPPQADPALVSQTVEYFSKTDPKVGVSAMYELFNWSASHRDAALNQFSHQLRNINADPENKGQPVNASVVLIPGVGHFVAQENPDAFNQALDGILNDFGVAR
ncbi:MAG TPA: alpha/beta hydrolase [Gammaproteobacteria bacterium]|nr:alpha/beta hydrolase [Gammaproteobacteria bacterium]